MLKSTIKQNIFLGIFLANPCVHAQEITPYKFKNHPYEIVHEITASCRFTVSRPEHNAPEKEFMGMTYLYHADALQYPLPEYPKIKTPFLVVCGTQDSFIASCDAFVEKARAAGVNITYLRVEGMDHYVRKRTDIVEQSFEWLAQMLR